jgi:membrane protease subunit HflK
VIAPRNAGGIAAVLSASATSKGKMATIKFPSKGRVPQFSFGWVRPVLFALAIIVGLWTTFYTVPAESEGVLLRFGRFDGVVPSGLHFKLPLGIDIVKIVPVKRQLKQEFGFGTPGSSNPLQSSPQSEWLEEKSMVTGDLNAAQVEWVIQYRIERPDHYLFNVRDPDATLRGASESVMREVVGDRTVDEVITIGRQEVEDEALQKLRKVVTHYGMGIKVDQVQLKNVNPPDRVQASFNEVNQAQQEKERAINIANGEYNKEIPRARGRAAQSIRAAEGYAKQRVNQAEGEVAAFNALLAEFVKAPEVTRRRLYLETMAEVLSRVKSKVIVGEEVKGLLPMLSLDKLPGVVNGGAK